MVGDNHPEESSSINDQLNQIFRQQIQYYFGFIKKVDTEKMITEFNKTLHDLGGGQMYIQQHDATDPSLIEKIVFETLMDSISKTLAHKSLCCPPKINSMPNMDSFVEERGLITPPFNPSVTENEIRLVFPSLIANVKRCTKSFAEGKCRRAYHGTIVDTNERVVLKENKEDIELKRYLENYHAHLTSIVYAEMFNKEKPSGVKIIEFVLPSLFLFKIDLVWKCFFVEPYIEGDFTKFNNNGGSSIKPPDPSDIKLSSTNDALQAFSHYSWQKSGHQILVCDLQGVLTEKGALLTDPSVHSATEDVHFGITDLLQSGIDAFFTTHKCNNVCKEMKLN